MAIKDIFKKKAVPQEKKSEEETAEKEEVKTAKKQADKPAKSAKKSVVSLVAAENLVTPWITEKSMELANNQNQYVFKVGKSANKIEVRKAIEDVYGVEVNKVRIVNIPRKERRLGRNTGWKKGFKKAIVSIRRDQKIDVGLG